MSGPMWECGRCGSHNVRATKAWEHRPRRVGVGVFRCRKCVECGEVLRTVEVRLMDAAPILPRFSRN